MYMAATMTTMKMKFFLTLLISMLPGNYEAHHNYVNISCDINCFEIFTDPPCAYFNKVIINGTEYHHDYHSQEQSYCVYHYAQAPLCYQCYNSTSNNISCNNLPSFSNSKMCLDVPCYKKQFGMQSIIDLCLNSSCSHYQKHITITNSTCDTTDPPMSVLSSSKTSDLPPTKTSFSLSSNTKATGASIPPSTTDGTSIPLSTTDGTSTPPSTTDGTSIPPSTTDKLSPTPSSPGEASSLKATKILVLLLFSFALIKCQ